MTWFQAEQACRLSGKRLLTNQEWQAAAAGTVDPGANDGLANALCNTSSAGPRNTGLAGATAGGADSCISNWGVQDMVGNVWEWVADWGTLSALCGVHWGSTSADDLSCVAGTLVPFLPGARIRGGHWGSGTEAGVFAVTDNYAPTNELFFVGFRCAR